MERKHSGTPGLAPRRGIGGDFERAREGGTATVAELREFLQNFRGKSPQEALGVVAQSGLVQATAASTLGALLIILIFTVIPYLWRTPAEEVAKAAPQTAASTGESTGPAAPAAAHATGPAAAPAAASNTAEAVGQRTLDALGESETKVADPDKNPLDNLDNLLDDAN